MKRSPILLTLLMLVSFVVGPPSPFSAEAGVPPDRSYQTAPPLRLDSLHLRAQERALDLFRQGCLEVKVVILPDGQDDLQVYATCIEWQEARPAS